MAQPAAPAVPQTLPDALRLAAYAAGGASALSQTPLCHVHRRHERQGSAH